MNGEVISVKEHHQGPLKHYLFLTKPCQVYPMLCTLFHKRNYACMGQIFTWLHGGKPSCAPSLLPLFIPLFLSLFSHF